MSEKLKSAKINGKRSTMNVLISGICLIISALIGIFSVNINVTNESLETENTKLSEQNNDWETAYINLQKQFDDLNIKNISLMNEIDNLKNNFDQHSNLITNNTDLVNENNLLIEENNSLRDKIVQLENEKKELENKIKKLEGSTIEEPLNSSSDKKVSIFDLNTFQGEAHWFKNTSFPFSEEDDWLIDMYGNEFHTGYIAFHGDEKQKVDAIYNLDNKYSQCNIKIAWPRGAKNLVDAGAYIKFYSDGEFLDISPEIKCGDEPIEFSINLSGVEKFSFERIATGKGNPWMKVTIIYCYFDLIENET